MSKKPRRRNRRESGKPGTAWQRRVQCGPWFPSPPAFHFPGRARPTGRTEPEASGHGAERLASSRGEETRTEWDSAGCLDLPGWEQVCGFWSSIVGSHSFGKSLLEPIMGFVLFVRRICYRIK